VVIDGMLMLGVASFGLLANLFCVLLLKRDSDKTINIKSAYLHLISDTVSSLAVIIGAVVIYFFKFYYIDSLFTVLIGVYVLREGYKILLETINILMQAAPKDIDINAILKEINTLPEIDNLHHVHIWQTNDRDIFFEGHIDLCHDYRLSEADAIRKKIEIILKEKFKIKHVTLQPEFDICEDKKIIPG
jgi:cobalt-zinc-cadmium efflux system protein